MSEFKKKTIEAGGLTFRYSFFDATLLALKEKKYKSMLS